MKLNLGCGEKSLPGFINCDKLPWVPADKHFDLEAFPWPFEPDSVDYVLMDNVLEHLNDISATITELHRILKPGGVVKIIVPYAGAMWAYIDPTHKRFFTERSMDHYKRMKRWYALVDFDVKAKLVAHRHTWAHRVRNLIPFRRALRFFLHTMYDVVEFELTKSH